MHIGHFLAMRSGSVGEATTAKDAYLIGFNAAFVLGNADADSHQPRDPSHVSGEFFGAYLAGYDLNAVRSLILPCLLQNASKGYDDGLISATKLPPTIAVGDTVCQVNADAASVQYMNDDFRIVYSDAYTAGLTYAAANPVGPVGPTGPTGPTGPGPTGPTGPGPAGPVAMSTTGIVLLSIGAVAATVGVAYAMSGPSNS